MSTDLEKLASDKSRSNNDGHIKFADLPESLRVLGREEDYVGSYYQVSHEGKGVTASVGFGQMRRRCWGICIGPEQRGDIFQRFRKMPVATNAFFFMGLDPG